MGLLVPKRALSLAWSTIKGRKGGFVAAFVAVLAGSAVITASGMLLETGTSSGVPTERYGAAAAVVAADQTLSISEDIDPRFAERVRLPADAVDRVAGVPGVRAAVGDISVAMSLVDREGRLSGGPEGSPLFAHGWSAGALGPFTLAGGEGPDAPDEVALESDLAERAGLGIGDPVTLVLGSTPTAYRVSGLVDPPGGELLRQSAVFLTDERVRQLSGHPDRVDAVGVLTDPGVDPADLADELERAVPGAVAHTGDDRSDAESLDIGATRSFVIELALSFGATMVMVVVIIVASTLALSVQQRRRELALLRAIGATPKQVLAMIGAEATLVGAAGAVLGAIPGIGLGVVFHRVFAAVGVLPRDFALVITPLPVLAAVLLCVAAARVGGWIAARRAAKVSPVEALGDAAVEPRALGRVRMAIGLLLVPAGLAAAIVLPIALPGESAVDGASSSALVLVIAFALLGPRLLRGAVAVLGPRLVRSGQVSGFLAVANARARSRRLSAATSPLIMGVTMAAAQLFSATTLGAAAQEQATEGVVADYALLPGTAGLSPGLADEVRRLGDVAAVTPVVRTRTILTFASDDSTQFRIFATQGVDAGGVAATLDLGVLDGDLAGLRGEAVALSRLAAGTVGAGVGDTVDLHLGDGTAMRARVVAIYEKGFGFGDVTLPHESVIGHTTDGLDTWMLVDARPGADPAAVGEALRSVAARHPGVEVADGGAVAAAQGGAGADSAVSFLLNAVLLGYIAIAVVNTLVMATVARVREFALLRLVGADHRQVRSMMAREATIIVAAAALIGAVATIPSLIGVSFAVSRSPVPSISPLTCLGIVAAVAAVTWPAIMVSTRIAMRPRPVHAVKTGE